MSDPIRQPQLYAWTAGPWYHDPVFFHRVTTSRNVHEHIATVVTRPADAALIALAPEMAEAISAAARVARIHGGNLRECFVRLIEIDDLLRAIGGAS